MSDSMRRELALRLMRSIKTPADIEAMPAAAMLLMLEVFFQEAPVAASTLFRDHIVSRRAEYIGLATKRLEKLKSVNPIDLQQVREVETLLDLFRRA